VYAATGGDGWVGSLLGLAVGEGGRLFVVARGSDSDGGRSVHLRPQGAGPAVAVIGALNASALRPTGATDTASGAGQRTAALVLVILAGIGLAVISIREWRGGAGGRSVSEMWQNLRVHLPGAGRSGT
jgi:hypothetical protein